MLGLRLNNKVLEIPIIQGGMGIGVSLGNLAGSVMKQGGMGTISAANPGYKKTGFMKNPAECNLVALNEQIVKARSISEGRGVLAVNIMVKGTNYENLVKQALISEVDVIISGAGLPLELPKLVKNSSVAIAPIVSSAKAASVICRSWERKHQRYPDFIVIEGPDAGGHLGFNRADLENFSAPTLEQIFAEVKKIIKPFEINVGRSIPLFVAGGIYTNNDIKKYLTLGATGVQIGTRFIATHECDASDEFKQKFLDAKKSDIVITKSPAGLPGRALKNTLTKTLENTDRIKPRWCVNCLESCNPKTTIYCISEALINAVSDKIEDHALLFSGTNGYRLNKIISVEELIKELIKD